MIFPEVVSTEEPSPSTQLHDSMGASPNTVASEMVTFSFTHTVGLLKESAATGFLKTVMNAIFSSKSEDVPFETVSFTV